MAGKVLHVLMHGAPMGTVIQRAGKLKFIYEESWQSAERAVPLSLSMPLSGREHPDRVISAYMWNLLPDNSSTLRAWARMFGVRMNVFSLLEHTGEDVAGAAQFVRPDRLEAIQTSDTSSVEWIDEAEIARRLRELRTDQTAWIEPGAEGYFSLSGAQPKIALHRTAGGRWGIPSGRIPTTHILKPPTSELEGFAENEHFCLSLARKAGLPAARSEVMRFGDEIAFVTERFDRVLIKRQLLRVPMEDFCQALAVPPERKYQNMGGPGPREILELLSTESADPAEDCETFFTALAFNALIGGTDAHAKNYSVLLEGSRARLAPLYDIASALPYYDRRKLKLAMKIGSSYELARIRPKDWDRLGELAHLGPGAHQRVRELADRLPELMEETAEELKAQEVVHPIVEQLVDSISANISAWSKAK